MPKRRRVADTSPKREEERQERREAAKPEDENESSIQALVDAKLVYRGNDPRFKLEWVSTGIPALDKVLGGGLPRGRFTIIAGEYSSAKTFLVQMLMKQALGQGLMVAYIDTERTYEPTWWAQVGLPLDKVLVSQPNTGEKAIDVVMALVRAKVDVVAVDSLAALIPSEEAHEDAKGKDKRIGLQAQLISKMLRMLLSTEHNSVVVLTNQLRDVIGGPGPVDKMPGGQSQLFFSSMILRTKRQGWLEEQGKRVGFYLRVICRKSKVSQPFGECVLPFRFRGEIDLIAMLVDRAVEAGLVKQQGPWFTLRLGDLKAQKALGRHKMVEFLQEHEDVRKQLEIAIGEDEQA